ncbi:MAG: hypothetical protein AAB453_00350 [Patescibacteria group bacterium]
MVEEIIRPNVGELSLFKKLERNNQPLSGGMIMDINGCSRSENHITYTTKIVLARVASGLVAVDGEYFRLPVVGGWGVFSERFAENAPFDPVRKISVSGNGDSLDPNEWNRVRDLRDNSPRAVVTEILRNTPCWSFMSGNMAVLDWFLRDRRSHQTNQFQTLVAMCKAVEYQLVLRPNDEWMIQLNSARRAKVEVTEEIAKYRVPPNLLEQSRIIEGQIVELSALITLSGGKV